MNRTFFLKKEESNVPWQSELAVRVPEGMQVNAAMRSMVFHYKGNGRKMKTACCGEVQFFGRHCLE